APKAATLLEELQSGARAERPASRTSRSNKAPKEAHQGDVGPALENPFGSISGSISGAESSVLDVPLLGTLDVPEKGTSDVPFLGTQNKYKNKPSEQNTPYGSAPDGKRREPRGGQNDQN